MLMRKIVSSIVVLFLLTQTTFAQHQYEIVSTKPEERIFKGIISREVLVAEPSFTWYAENLKGYTPNTLAVEAFRQYKDSIEVISFMGTWCGDSHAIVPKFFTLLDAAGFPKERVTLIGVDRSKKTLSHLAEALNVINVPTTIIMKGGKEIGRVVEYGKYGMWDKELGEIIKAGFTK